MLFQMPVFFGFFAVFVALMAVCPRRYMLPYVIIASLVFYAWWYPPYVWLLLAFILMAWGGTRTVQWRRSMLPVVIVILLLPLGIFKYADFVTGTVRALTGFEAPQLGWMLPLGISFVTFTMISLVVDAARKTKTGPLSLLRIGVYITVFPHLIAGPILRARQVIPQLDGMGLDWRAFGPNLALFAVGMAKKVLIADPIGTVVDRIYAAGPAAGSIESILAVVGFNIQIYCDFSAYSDMAIALAGMIGLAFPENFSSPYKSASITEIWQRWHMTLGHWLRDYVFFPLHSRLRRVAFHGPVVLTMLVSGLWHGADWTFVLWGALNGLFLAIERITGFAKYAKDISLKMRFFLAAIVFCVFGGTNILFRAPDMETAYTVFSGVFGARGWGDWPVDGVLLAGLAAVILVFHPFDRAEKIRSAARQIPAVLSWPVLLTVIALCSMLAAGRPNNFYYFDF